PSFRKSCKGRNSQPIRSRRSFADRKYALAATVRPSAQLTRKTRLFRPPLSCSKASARVPQAFSSAASTFSSSSSFFIGRRNRPVLARFRKPSHLRPRPSRHEERKEASRLRAGSQVRQKPPPGRR